MVLKYQFPFGNPDTRDGFGSLIDRSTPHRGLDFAQPIGTGIPAAAAGYIALKHYTGALGHITVVAHPDGMFTGYCHSQQASPLGLGAVVARGQVINHVGNLGQSTGPHLHLTLSNHVNGVFEGQVQDPYTFINARLNGDDPGTATPITEDDELTARLYRNSANGDVRAICEATGLDYGIPNPDYLTLVLGWGIFKKADTYDLPDNIFQYRREIARLARVAINTAS